MSLYSFETQQTQEIPFIHVLDTLEDNEDLIVPHEEFVYVLEDYRVVDKNVAIFANAAVSDINIYLTSQAHVVRVEKIDTTNNIVTLHSPKGETIEGNTKFNLRSGTLLLVKGEKSWHIVGSVDENDIACAV